MRAPLTKRQKEILDYIDSFIKRKGYSPSLEEIKNVFGLKAISTVHEHLENLKRKGYISKDMNQARGILIKKEKNRLLPLKVTDKILDKKIRKFNGEKRSIYYFNRKDYDHTAIKAIMNFDEGQENSLFKKDIVIVFKTKKAKRGDLILNRTQNENEIEVKKYTNSKDCDVYGKILSVQRILD